MFSTRIVPITLAAAFVGLQARSHWKRYTRCKTLVQSNFGFDGIGWSYQLGYYVFDSKAEAKSSPCEDKGRVYVDAWGNAYRRDPVLSCHTSCIRFFSKQE